MWCAPNKVSAPTRPARNAGMSRTYLLMPPDRIACRPDAQARTTAKRPGASGIPEFDPNNASGKQAVAAGRQPFVVNNHVVDLFGRDNRPTQASPPPSGPGKLCPSPAPRERTAKRPQRRPAAACPITMLSLSKSASLALLLSRQPDRAVKCLIVVINHRVGLRSPAPVAQIRPGSSARFWERAHHM